jgi:THO complex subunit 4
MEPCTSVRTHSNLTQELFSRIGDVLDVKIRYDRAGRSEGVAFVNYRRISDANSAIREFDGANAKGQPIRLTLLQQARRDNPFDRVENPRSLFDRIEAPNDRRRSQSPFDEDGEDRYRRGPRRGGPGATRDRRTDTTRPAPENIDRYIPGQNGGGPRSDSRRGGRRPGERKERRPRNDEAGHKLVGGRPRKTQEELDAEMEDYWGGNAAPENGQAGDGVAGGTKAATVQPSSNTEPEIDMMVE